MTLDYPLCCEPVDPACGVLSWKYALRVASSKLFNAGIASSADHHLSIKDEKDVIHFVLYKLSVTPWLLISTEYNLYLSKVLDAPLKV